MRKTSLLILAITISKSILLAQDDAAELGKKLSNRNKLTIAISHTHVPSGIDENGKKVWLALPSWGLDYDLSISNKWGLGVHSDIVIQDFQYEEEGDGIIKKRSKPLATAFVGTYEAAKHLKFIAGGGAEFASEGTLGLVRLGADCGWELPKDWEVSFSLMADIKINAYNAWVLGIGVGRRF